LDCEEAEEVGGTSNSSAANVAISVTMALNPSKLKKSCSLQKIVYCQFLNSSQKTSKTLVRFIQSELDL
jgi:hypothetical protein